MLFRTLLEHFCSGQGERDTLNCAFLWKHSHPLQIYFLGIRILRHLFIYENYVCRKYVSADYHYISRRVVVVIVVANCKLSDQDKIIFAPLSPVSDVVVIIIIIIVLLDGLLRFRRVILVGGWPLVKPAAICTRTVQACVHSFDPDTVRSNTLFVR